MSFKTLGIQEQSPRGVLLGKGVLRGASVRGCDLNKVAKQLC